MTAVIDEPVAVPRPAAADATGPAEAVRRAAPAVTAAVAAALVLAWFFGAFVTHVWYDTRQRALGTAGLSLVAPRDGQAAGLLQSQSPLLDTEIVQGVSAADLRAGPGHDPGTPLPGSRGNSVIYGHRTLWGGPFAGLGQLAAGQPIIVRSLDGNMLAYDVTRVVRTTAAGSRAFLGPSTDYRLTLVTGLGGRSSDLRLVVVAVSGTHGHGAPVPPGAPTVPPRADPAGFPLFEMIGFGLAAVAVAALLAGRHRRAVVIVAVSPLLAGAVVGACLEVSLLWSPLA